MNWHRLDRDTSTKVIASVTSEAEAGLFSATTSEVTRAQLRFYESYALYKIVNYASLPSFTFEYLSDGQFFHYLDGTEEPIYAVNAKGALKLSEQNILPYLTFYFEHVSGAEGEERRLIDDPHDMPLLDSLGTSALDTVMRLHKAPKIDYDGGLQAYVVEADIYDDGQVLRATIEVKENGKVKIAHEETAMHRLTEAGQSDLMV